MQLVGGGVEQFMISLFFKKSHSSDQLSRLKFKILLLTCKGIANQPPSYLKALIEPYHPTGELCSQTESLLVVSLVFKS